MARGRRRSQLTAEVAEGSTLGEDREPLCQKPGLTPVDPLRYGNLLRRSAANIRTRRKYIGAVDGRRIKRTPTQRNAQDTAS